MNPLAGTLNKTGGLNTKMSEERIELSTNGLKGHCSAIELLAHNGSYSITSRYFGQ